MRRPPPPDAARTEPALPLDPPRPYTLRDAWRGRVWRSGLAAVLTDLVVLGVALVLAGIAHEEDALLLVGGAVAGVALVLGRLASFAANVRRCRLIRAGTRVEATVERPRRLFLLHELFRGERERTFALRYRFEWQGQTRRGRVYVCGCALPYFPPKSHEPLAVDARDPGHSLPLRLAVMRAPHG